MYHRPLLASSAQILRSVFRENQFADKSIERAFRDNKRWGARDRRFIAESVFECVRHWRRLLYVTGQTENDVNFWHIVAAYWYLKTGDMPQFPETESLNSVDLKSKAEEAQKQRSLRESLPDWLDQKLAENLEDITHVLAELNKEAPVFLRVNHLKTDINALQSMLQEEDVETEQVSHEALTLQKRKPVFKTKAYRQGLFEVQDLSSQLVGQVIDPQPGERIIDACAGAGGKSLHLATLMKNKGKVLSLDIRENKLKELRKRASRNSIDIIECRPINSSKVIKRLKEKGDTVLLDVPCTGLGVLRRNPDTKWKLTEEDLERVKTTQRELLDSYSSMVRPGGHLVYSTCSVLREENRDQVDWFLDSEMGQGFEIVEEKVILPAEGKGDGFYICKLKKN